MTKRIAVLINSVVDNVIAQPDDYIPGQNEVDVSALPVSPGDVYSGEVFSKPAVPKTYTKARFKEFCYSVLGAMVAPSGTDDEILAAGIAALGAINKAMHASTDDAIYQVADEYDKADTFDKVKTIKLLGILQTTGIVSTPQLAALSASWENLP